MPVTRVRVAAPFGAALHVSLVGAFCVLASAPSHAEAQRLTYSRGQPIHPAYEGWRRNPDGSLSMMFGYMNENWEEELDIPVGLDNSFSPGPADRGQPTHFLPRRNRFVFEVSVPADFGADRELVWTVRANGREVSAYGTLAEDYFVDNVVIMSETGALGAGTSSPEIRANEPPAIQVEGAGERATQVGRVLTLEAIVTDEDGQPPPEGYRGAEAPEPDATPRDLLDRALTWTRGSTVDKAVGLHFTWFVYRGAGSVVFDPPQIEPWEDTRQFANSPWAPYWVPPGLRIPSELPNDGRWVTQVRFDQPGTYVLRGRADDGGLYSDVSVTVRVAP